MHSQRHSPKIYNWLPLVFLSVFCLICSVGAAQGAGSTDSPGMMPEATPSDVFFEVQRINADLKNLRLYMGAPKAMPLGIHVHKAAPHDVYSQAKTLFQKANRLSFEIVRQQEPAPPLPGGLILPANVLILVRGAHRSIQHVLADLKIPDCADIKPEPDAPKTPSHVFRAILATNRQVNELLERRFSPSDAYMEVTLAIGHASRQLAQYPGSIRIPDASAFEGEKRPSDVYFRLLGCLDIISRIYKTAGLEMLVIDTARIDEESITPSDVFDMASLIVARLDFLHKELGLVTMPREVFYLGRKYPSDVYQQTGLLEKQLKQLERLIKTTALSGR